MSSQPLLAFESATRRLNHKTGICRSPSPVWHNVISFLLFFTIAAWLVAPAAHSQTKQDRKHPQKLSRPIRLDAGVTYLRNPASGELEIASPGGIGAAGERDQPSGARAIRVVTQVVPVTCSAFGSDGTPLRDLTPKDFRVYDDGVERPIVLFNERSSDPASIALVIDASPSVLRDSQEMKDAASALIERLAPADEVAIVDFSAHTYLQTGFSSVRELLRRAVNRVDVRQILGDTGGSNIYEAVYLTARKLFPGRAGRKAIVLLTDGQDSGLGLTLDPASASPHPWNSENRLTFDDVTRELASHDIQIFAVSTENRPQIMTRDWLAAHSATNLLMLDARKLGIPAYTLYLAELVRRSGGELYFLREADTLAETFRRIATRVGTEYSLGISPLLGADSAPQPGWHQLRVEVIGRGSVSVVHRAAYYVPASAQ
ncbi:MAG: VWA domain-containing protein [Candidatus Acidiferrales bacterium]